MGVCYDGVEGLLYLCLFSLLAAGAFCTMLCAIPRAWRQIANRYTHIFTRAFSEMPQSPQLYQGVLLIQSPEASCLLLRSLSGGLLNLSRAVSVYLNLPAVLYSVRACCDEWPNRNGPDLHAVNSSYINVSWGSKHIS